MKILHVVNVSFVIPYFFGEQINFFQKKGFDVYLVCSDSVDLNPLSSKYGFKYKAINIDRKFGLFSSIISFFQLYFFIRNNRFDIVVGHTPKASFLAMLASYFNFVPRRIYLRHGILYETSSGFKRGILIFFEKFTSLLSTKVLCVSQSVLNISLNDNLNSSHKTCLISKGSCNGVDSVNFFNPDLVTKETLNIYKAKHNIDDNDFVIGFVGRIVNDKGIKEILLAWDVLKSRYKNLKLILAGPLEDRDGIHSHLISKILNDNRIVFLGQIKETNVYYKLMNLFLLPSYREGFPTVILEASSMGLPIVTSRKTGCIDSIIENVTGKYCEISPNSIVQVLDEYIQNSDLCIQHGLNGRKFVRENFEQEVIWNSLLKLYSGEN